MGKDLAKDTMHAIDYALYHKLLHMEGKCITA